MGTPHTYFGFRVKSASPGFTVDTPEKFYTDFSKLIKLTFASKPRINPSLLGPVMGSVGLIPTTKINAVGKATTDPGYYVKVDNAAFGGGLHLIGNRVTLTGLYGSGARKYRILHAEPGSSTYTPLVTSWRSVPARR